MVPARTRYDHELVFEHVESYARRHGTVHLEIDRREFTVSYLNGAEHRLCSSCNQPLELLTYALGGRSLCLRCARAGSR